MSQDEQEIRSAIDDWAEGVRTKDIERCLAHYADDAVQFDIAPPLKNTGKDVNRKNLEMWFPSFAGQIRYDITDLQVYAADDVAFAHCINHMTGTRSDGEDTDVWLRATVGLRRVDAKWLIVHEHVSVPFYMDGSMRAAVDLKP